MRSKLLWVVSGAAALALSIPLVAQKAGTPKPRLSSLDANAVAYIRPGVKVKIGKRKVRVGRGGRVSSKAIIG